MKTKTTDKRERRLARNALMRAANQAKQKRGRSFMLTTVWMQPTNPAPRKAIEV